MIFHLAEGSFSYSSPWTRFLTFVDFITIVSNTVAFWAAIDGAKTRSGSLERPLEATVSCQNRVKSASTIQESCNPMSLSMMALEVENIRMRAAKPHCWWCSTFAHHFLKTENCWNGQLFTLVSAPLALANLAFSSNPVPIRMFRRWHIQANATSPDPWQGNGGPGWAWLQCPTEARCPQGGEVVPGFGSYCLPQ